REIRALGRWKQLQRLNAANGDQEEQRPHNGYTIIVEPKKPESGRPVPLSPVHCKSWQTLSLQAGPGFQKCWKPIPPAWPNESCAIRMELLRTQVWPLPDRQKRPDTQIAAAFPEKWRRESGTSVPDVALNARGGWEQEFVAVEHAAPKATNT